MLRALERNKRLFEKTLYSIVKVLFSIKYIGRNSGELEREERMLHMVNENKEKKNIGITLVSHSIVAR